MTSFQPDPGDISLHLRYLSEPTAPDNQFELRCFDRGGHPRHQLFTCGVIERAVDWACAVNQAGHNVYVTCNPVRPDLVGYANDRDMVEAWHQFIDIDGTDDAARLITELGGIFRPSLIVQTGTTPQTRFHAYWRMDRPLDLSTWRDTQRALAEAFDSDPAVINPSRLVRLAGTISYPPAHKQRRGYVEERTALVLGRANPVDPVAFQAAYARSAPKAPESTTIPSAPPQAVAETGLTADIPLAIVEQALNAIPPIQESGCRRDWLGIGLAVKAANPAAEATFRRWQRQSPYYDRTDKSVWATLDPTPGSYAKLFKEAAVHDPD